MCGLCTSRRIRATAPMCPAGSAGGPFEPADRPVVCMPHERGLVDASVRTSEAGLVLYFKSTGFDTLDRPSKLWGARLAPGGAALAGAPVHLLSQTAQWEARGGVGCIEAPAMLTAGQRHFLLYSGGDWTAGLLGVPYSIGYAACETLLGPCTKRTVRAPWFGPAYNDTVGIGGQEVFRDSAGAPWLVFHGWRRGEAGYGDGGRRAVRFYPLADIEALAGKLR